MSCRNTPPASGTLSVTQVFMACQASTTRGSSRLSHSLTIIADVVLDRLQRFSAVIDHLAGHVAEGGQDLLDVEVTLVCPRANVMSCLLEKSSGAVSRIRLRRPSSRRRAA